MAKTASKKPARKIGPDKFRTQELAKIHIAKKWAGDNKPSFNQESYEAIILEVSNKRTTSSGDLDWKERQLVIKRFKELGWEDQPGRKAFSSPDKGRSGGVKTRRLADDPQSVMLRAMWIQLHQAGKVKDPSEKALCKFVKRMTKVDALDWLNDRQVTVVKKALKDWLEREVQNVA